MKIARVYLRVSSEEQDLARQERLIDEARSIAGIYKEKASGACPDRPELLRMIADLQQGDVVIAEKIDRLTRLPLPEAEKLIASIREKGARLSVPDVVDLSSIAENTQGVSKIVLELFKTCFCAWHYKWQEMIMRAVESVNGKGLR